MWKLPVIHLVLTELSKNTRVTNLFKLKKRIRKGKNIGGIGIQNQRPSMGSNNCKNQEKSFLTELTKYPEKLLAFLHRSW